MSSQVKNCKCGNYLVELNVLQSSVENKFYYKCSKCGMKSNLFSTTDEALNNWNENLGQQAYGLNYDVDKLLRENEYLRNTLKEVERQKVLIAESLLMMQKEASEDKRDKNYIDTCAFTVLNALITSKMFTLDDIQLTKSSYVIAARMLEESKRRTNQGWLKEEN